MDDQRENFYNNFYKAAEPKLNSTSEIFEFVKK